MKKEDDLQPEDKSLDSARDDEVKKPFIKRFWWVFAVALVLVIVGAVSSKILFKRAGKKEEKKVVNQEVQENSPAIDPENPPKFIQADILELDKVFSISKFRSGLGHDYSYLSGETCRSMKHYISVMDETKPVYKYEGLTIDKYPQATLENGVKIFSPVDGTLRFNEAEDKISYNLELQVTPDAFPDVVIGLGHVQKAPGVKEGKVRAGDLIGLVLANQNFDLAIQTHLTQGGEKKIGYISYFATLPNNIFAKYQARGVKSRDDLILSKEYRDAHPLSCHDKEVFDKDYPSLDGRASHIFDLIGYQEMEAKINAKYPVKNIVETPNTKPTRR